MSPTEPRDIDGVHLDADRLKESDMDLNWQPAPPEDDSSPPAEAMALTPAAPTASGDPQLGPPTPLGDDRAAPAATKAMGLRRIIATAALTIGLLAVGGVSVVMAASPAPSSSTAPSTTQPRSSTGGTHTGPCPNMGGSSGSSSSPSSGSGTGG
jgi:hypothetical protein